MAISVTDNVERYRYEASVGGALAGFAAYRLEGSTIEFTHTEVDKVHEGHGVGSGLVGQALDDVRERGLRVRPLCPFVRSYIERYPAYQDLVG